MLQLRAGKGLVFWESCQEAALGATQCYLSAEGVRCECYPPLTLPKDDREGSCRAHPDGYEHL